MLWCVKTRSVYGGGLFFCGVHTAKTTSLLLVLSYLYLQRHLHLWQRFMIISYPVSFPRHLAPFARHYFAPFPRHLAPLARHSRATLAPLSRHLAPFPRHSRATLAPLSRTISLHPSQYWISQCTHKTHKIPPYEQQIYANASTICLQKALSM